MKKFFIVVFVLMAAGKYGRDYIMSDKFQTYGDKTKAPWTCQVNNFLGHMLMVTSEYQKAMPFFEKTIARCPETAACEVAEFEIAECLAKTYRPREALAAYKDFAEKYKGSKRAKIAERATQIINAS